MEANTPSRSNSCTAPSDSTETLTDSKPSSDKVENADGSCVPGEAISERNSRTASLFRKLSNTTYVRRMQLNKVKSFNFSVKDISREPTKKKFISQLSNLIQASVKALAAAAI